MTAYLFMLLALLAAGDTATVNDRGEALRTAARDGDAAKVRALLEAGVPVDAPEARYGMTPLLLAAGKGHTDIVRLLLDRGANVNARERFFQSTPLTAALQAGNLELARLLLDRGAAQTVEAMNEAIEKDDIGLAKSALAAGKLKPLELKALRKAAAGKPAMLELLAPVTAQPASRRPFTVTPEKLRAYAGRYRTREGGDVTIVTRGNGLVLSGTGIDELVLMPVAEDEFETPTGNASVTFGGRAGTVEYATVNRDGEISGINVVTTDPQPLKKAESAPNDSSAPRGEPKPWPQFRGPGASGIGDGQGVPLTWDLAKNQNLRFKTPIPGIALSSPIIWGDRIFVTSAVSSKGDATFKTGLYGDGSSVDDLSEHSFKLYSLDARTGKILWERELHKGVPTVRRHLKSSLANATPATDGKQVVVLIGTVGLLASYDFSGQKLWQRDIGILDCADPQSGSAEWGHASSPILYDDLVVVQGDRRADSFVAAYRLKDGEQVWRVARDETSTWATPNIVRATSGDELVTNGRLIRSYEQRTGKLLWSLGPNSEVIVSTPVVGDGKTFITAGYPPVRPIYAIRPGHRGDLSLKGELHASDAIAWSHERGGTYIPTPILYRGHLYLVNNNGILTCYNAETGEQVYQTRLGEVGASFSASPVAADGRLYFASETGEVYVLRAGPAYELLATNLMNETVMATPAASNGLFVVRTLGHVVGLGGPEPTAAAR